MLRVSRIIDFQELRYERESWNRLSPASVLSSAEWLWNWWNAYAGDDELFVLTVRDASEKLVAVAPWYRSRRLATGNTLRFLGSGKVCTDYQTILTLPEHRDAAVLALVEWLCEANELGRQSWDHLELDSTPQNDPALSLFSAALERRGAWIDVRPAASCWMIDLSGDWPSYRQRLKQRVRRKVRQLERDYLDTGRARLITSDEANNWQDGVERLVDFHQRRWATVGVEGCFSSKQFTSFLAQATGELMPLGRAWLTQLFLDDRPVAAALFLRNQDAYQLYQCGMDPDAREHQPGWLINVMHLRTLLQRGATTCDYLRGDERYKAELGATPVCQRRWRISAPGSVARLRHSLWLTQDRLRGWGKRIVVRNHASKS